MADAEAQRSALVTGASRGIGRAIAVSLAGDGFRVGINYRTDKASAEDAAQDVRRAGGEALLLAADMGDAAAVRAMVAAALGAFGHLDVVVLNAGICSFIPFFELTEETWDRTHAVNLKGAFLTAQAAARAMVERGRGGRIIAVSSVSAHVGGAEQVHYCPTKAGLSALMRSLALVLGPHGITCNAVLPGTIATDMNRDDLAREGKREDFERRIPLGRGGEPRDGGDVVKLLAREEARYINGAELVVDGGLLVNLQ
ncbi:SDR family oxidoreductase [soil metagenome]